MTFFSILETLLLGPLKLVFEIIFNTAYRFFRPGLAIVFLSLAINILVLPLYRRADAMQEAARDAEAKLHDGVAHIKKHFSGDERMMILQEYYRQNHYRPTDALRGSISLLLEIPFFIAAYQFLSNLEVLQWVPLGPIENLGAPDGLLVLGGISVNLLPILMTLINVVSSALYLKGFPLKTKVQVYGMALLFLVLLYRSPACLVFYWTLNNIFSLFKNIFYRLENSQRILRLLCIIIGVACLGLGVHTYVYPKRMILLCGIGLLFLLPALLPMLEKAVPTQKSKSQPNRKLFLLGAVFLTVLTGLLIPSVFIADSPQEYVDIVDFYHPLWYIARTFCMAAGTFLVWMSVFYYLASPKGKRLFEQLVWVLCGVTLVNYMFFGTDLGIISPTLQYDNGLAFSRQQQLINILALAAIVVILYFCNHKWKHVAANVLLIFIIALGAMSVRNLVTIKASVDEVSVERLSEGRLPQFQLSTEGKNIVVLMLDRAMGGYVPYLFNEKPELKEKFDGFTYYENTVSFGGETNAASSALFGGYEYTPVEMNKRKEESMVSKHNEALKLMPALFSENGYEITVCDSPYANYQQIPDLGIFDVYPGVTTFATNGRFNTPVQKQKSIDRNFFCFSVMKSLPLFLQPAIYDNGQYLQDVMYTDQARDGLSIASGIATRFTDSYQVLLNLPNMTNVVEDTTNTFLSLYNYTVHSPMLLQEPDYVPAQAVDNTAYDAAHTDRFTVDGRELKMENDAQVIHYHVNMAAMLQLGNWFDYLRENHVYDNTRIILAADHGYATFQLDALIMGDESQKDITSYYPLLMVKDFDSKGFTTSDTFMTNADVPTLAMKDVIPEPTNPFTGKAINSDEKTAHDQLIHIQGDWYFTQTSNTFLPATWASVKDNIWDKGNWSFYDEKIILEEHALP